jgi:hypothetical protein
MKEFGLVGVEGVLDRLVLTNSSKLDISPEVSVPFQQNLLKNFYKLDN